MQKCPRCGSGNVEMDTLDVGGLAECLLCRQCEADYARRPGGQWVLVRDFGAERRASVGADQD